MTQIELTQKELDVIQAIREEEEAKEKQKQKRINEDIAKAEIKIAKYEEGDKKQAAAAEVYLKELGKGWTGHITVREHTESVYYGMEVVWTKAYDTYRTHLMNGDYKVNVNEHTVYGGTWGRGTYKGYKMFVSGPEIDYKYSQKALVKAATVNSKIADCIDTINARVEAKKKKASAVETAVHDLQVAYPTAKVLAVKDWTRGYSSKNAYREYDKVTIEFTNGIQVAYEVYADGRLNRLSVDFGGLENNEVLNALSEIPTPISE